MQGRRCAVEISQHRQRRRAPRRVRPTHATVPHAALPSARPRTSTNPPLPAPPPPPPCCLVQARAAGAVPCYQGPPSLPGPSTHVRAAPRHGAMTSCSEQRLHPVACSRPQPGVLAAAAAGGALSPAACGRSQPVVHPHLLAASLATRASCSCSFSRAVLGAPARPSALHPACLLFLAPPAPACLLLPLPRLPRSSLLLLQFARPHHSII